MNFLFRYFPFGFALLRFSKRVFSAVCIYEDTDKLLQSIVIAVMIAAVQFGFGFAKVPRRLRYENRARFFLFHVMRGVSMLVFESLSAWWTAEKITPSIVERMGHTFSEAYVFIPVLLLFLLIEQSVELLPGGDYTVRPVNAVLKLYDRMVAEVQFEVLERKHVATVSVKGNDDHMIFALLDGKGVCIRRLTSLNSAQYFTACLAPGIYTIFVSKKRTKSRRDCRVRLGVWLEAAEA